MSNLHTKPPQLTPQPPQRLVLIIAALCAVGAIAVVATVVTLLPSRAENQIAPVAHTTTKTGERAQRTQMVTSDAVTSDTVPQIVDDDGQTLWASPTNGKPLELAYLPPGVQIIVALRPEAIAGHPEGDKVIDALGKIGARGAEVLAQMVGSLNSFDRIVIGCSPMSDGQWQLSAVGRLSGNRTAADHITSQLSDARPMEHDGQQYWLADEWAYFVPSQNKKLLVVTQKNSIAEVIQLAGEPPPLRRDIERLLAHTDAERHATILFAPNSLFSEGSALFAGEIEAARQPLFWFLGDELSAAALSLHWDGNFFVELLAIPSLDTPPDQAVQILADRLGQIADRLQQYVGGIELHPYGRAIVSRLPAMVRALARYTRTGFDADHAVLRAYLPPAAGHNLLMATELAFAERPTATLASTDARTETSLSTAEAESLDHRLKRVITLRIARDTLEAAIEQLAKEIGVSIVIRGVDLQAEGITKNQSLALDEQNKPAEQILAAILRIANPDKSAADLSDPRQKLVYVVEHSASGGGDQIIITTRTAATERGDILPPIFRRATP
jgi:hypothetical protein